MTRATRWSRRCSMVVAFATLASALVVPEALAGKPERQRLPVGDSFFAEPGLACPVAIAPEGVRSTVVGGNAVGTLFDNGTFVVTGRHPDEVTNVATGKSVVVERQGRVAAVPQQDGSTVLHLSGTEGFLFFPGDVGPGDDATGRIYTFTGNATIVIGALESVVSFASTGTMRDDCALIA